MASAALCLASLLLGPFPSEVISVTSIAGLSQRFTHRIQHIDQIDSHFMTETFWGR